MTTVYKNPEHLIQIGSSTWATHLLKMNNVPIYRKTPIHIVSRQHFPPLLGRRKEAFLKNAESFIVARDPFERLLSSFKVGSKYVIFFAMIKCCGDHQDKLNVTIRPTLVTWASFGQVQRVIKYKYRDSERPGTVPSFREFIKYLVRFILTEDDCVILISGWRTVAQLQEYEENDENDK